MLQKQEYHLLLGSVCFESSSREKRNVRILLFSRFFVSHLYMMFTEKYATATTLQIRISHFPKFTRAIVWEAIGIA